MSALAIAPSACIPRGSTAPSRRPAAAAAVRLSAFRPVRPARGPLRVRSQAAATATVDVKELNAKYGKGSAVEVKEGRGGLPTVFLKSAAGATAEIALFGGCVTSWKTAAGQEVLYIRPDAVFDKSKPISGGIPHCFPQFGPGAMQVHGFARNADWAVGGASGDAAKPAVTLVLKDSDYTRAMWPHAFKAEYTVVLDGEVLRTRLAVTNTDDKPLEFTASLHSYFGVADVETANVRGLQGLEYLDRVRDSTHPSVHQELRELATFRGPVDAVYKAAPAKVLLDNGSGDVSIASVNWPEVVVWTPWTAMEACYKEFVCVENALATSPAKLAPGAEWVATTAMAFSRDPLDEFCASNPEDLECLVYDD
ncbi:hypothetical protein CHLNCDRAFT_35636 [Chlorella variabilis]|uniref:glucose-6-phosphate 1-epimerase n=1 Tax=Chlorella variabilis TaxID=554065 RepID=E1ZG08_CHLVA|nr:hypothetical protein CHLNCDRAFT_35636 [Chlorella variabilis]EFN55380.1 hypothetical protein CHLNCDRAFT_35636 [Chlorella variabilis]|eukprot:XP_005847482.1 hypothetical protein CHLNCDRAFT_35636 [Chlorella variabilis]